MMTAAEKAAHSEGEADGEARIRDLVSNHLEGLEERMAAELVRNGWNASESRAAAYLLMPVLRDTVGSV